MPRDGTSDLAESGSVGFLRFLLRFASRCRWVLLAFKGLEMLWVAVDGSARMASARLLCARTTSYGRLFGGRSLDVLVLGSSPGLVLENVAGEPEATCPDLGYLTTVDKTLKRRTELVFV